MAMWPGEHFKCPKCGEKSEVYSRIVGYLRPVDQWNLGKKAEFEMRKTYKIKKHVNRGTATIIAH